MNSEKSITQKNPVENQRIKHIFSTNTFYFVYIEEPAAQLTLSPLPSNALRDHNHRLSCLRHLMTVSAAVNVSFLGVSADVLVTGGDEMLVKMQGFSSVTSLKYISPSVLFVKRLTDFMGL